MTGLTSARHVWTYRGLFLVLCSLVMLLKLLPLGLHQPGWPAPDILLALTLAWLMRQPAVVPLGAILIVFLLADFLFQRPPGLWTLMVVLGTESLRRRRLTMAEFPFLVEWSAVAVTVMTLVLLNRIVLWILMVDLAPLGLTLAHGIVTVAVYPLAVLISKFLLGLRKIGPAEAEAL